MSVSKSWLNVGKSEVVSFLSDLIGGATGQTLEDVAVLSVFSGS